jgi:hypothetical protein
MILVNFLFFWPVLKCKRHFDSFTVSNDCDFGFFANIYFP